MTNTAPAAPAAASEIISSAAPATLNNGEFTAAPATGAASPGNGQPSIIGGPFNPSQLAELANDLVARGRITQAQAADMLKAETGIAPPAAQTPEQAAINDMLPTPGKAGEFDIGAAYSPGDNPSTAEAAVVAQTVTAWLTAGEFDKAGGDFLIEHTAYLAKETEHWSNAEDEIYARTERERLIERYGDAYPAKLKAAQQFVARIENKTPGLVAMLEQTRAGSSALVIHHFIRAAEAQQMRHGKR